MNMTCSLDINIAVAVRFGKERGPDQTIVTTPCNFGLKYQSKPFNPMWLKEHRLDPKLPVESVLN
jgi:hypothetical protein